MFRKVTDRIYYRPHDGSTDRPNIGLILGDKYTLLFDAGNSAANVASLRAELAVQGLPEPDFVAVSHWQWWSHLRYACLGCDHHCRAADQ